MMIAWILLILMVSNSNGFLNGKPGKARQGGFDAGAGFNKLGEFVVPDDQPQRKSYGQSFTNYGPGYRRPLGTVPNFDAKFGEAKNYNNPRFNIRGQQIHYNPKFQNHGGESFSSSRKPLGSIPHIFNQSKGGHSHFGNNHFGYQKQQGNNFHRFSSTRTKYGLDKNPNPFDGFSGQISQQLADKPYRQPISKLPFGRK